MKIDNAWERYFNPLHPNYKYQRARFDWFMKHIHGQRFLDIGCAEGLAIFLAAKNNSITEIFGIDINEKAIFTAIKHLSSCKNIRINLYIADACNLKMIPDEYIDCVLIGETLEHINDDKKVMSEIARIMRSGGTLLISVPYCGQLSTQHLRIYTAESLNLLIEEANFKITEEDILPAAPKKYWLMRKAIKA